MPGFQPGIGMLTKYRGDTFQWHLDLSEADAVADTHCDLPDPDPAIVTIQECAVTRMVILNIDQTVFGQFHMGMQA